VTLPEPAATLTTVPRCPAIFWDDAPQDVLVEFQHNPLVDAVCRMFNGLPAAVTLT